MIYGDKFDMINLKGGHYFVSKEATSLHYLLTGLTPPNAHQCGRQNLALFCHTIQFILSQNVCPGVYVRQLWVHGTLQD